jgi:shikimate kinase
MQVRAVFLVGFMGSGKSTVGEELARRLGWDFVDLDVQIEAREHQSIAEIFALKGEPAFRRSETEILAELIRSCARNSVIALGGGAFAQAQNRELLKAWPSVFLNAPLEELWRRSEDEAKKRPLRKSRQQFCDLYWSRLPYYREATVTIETSGKQLPTICSEIESALRLQDAPESLSTGEPQ